MIWASLKSSSPTRVWNRIRGCLFIIFVQGAVLGGGRGEREEEEEEEEEGKEEENDEQKERKTVEKHKPGGGRGVS